MTLNPEQRKRLEEMLADRATGDLQPGQQDELARVDDPSFEMAAAAIDEAFATALPGGLPALPAELRSRLIASGRASLAGTEVEAGRPSTPPPVADFQAASARRDVPKSGSIVPWLLAAAASLLAIVGWWQVGDHSAPAATPPPTVAELRQELLRSAPDLLRLSWTATEDEASLNAEGDVVWSSTENTGFMRIAGLKANDPSEFQYQLWIFDKDRDERYPVDGGVFDIPADALEADGGVIVPIRAKLPVDSAVLFAITVERPGGVVVSSRERIVLLAQDV